MGCGASSEPGQTYTWHGKWGGDDEPGEYVLGRAPGCIETAVMKDRSSPTSQRYAKPHTSFIGDAKLAAASARESAGEKARELAVMRSRPSPKEFLLAVEEGDAAVVGEMLKEGALIDAVGSGVKTPLIVACEHGHAMAAQVLIRQGANIYAICGDSGATPLLLACAVYDVKSSDAIVTELCANRINLWPVRARCSSPNSCQASDGQYTPFSVLCENGRTATIERLLNRGLIIDPPDPAAPDGLGGGSPWSRMAWAQAVGGKHTNTPPTSLIPRDVSARLRVITEGVVFAASMGEIGVVRLCLDNQLPPDSRDRKGWTALGRAVQCGGNLPQFWTDCGLFY